MDFLALIGALGLLLWLFRHIERWLHQHIFKVGWLLTNNFQITTVLYYIVFLPGILLHESTLWLAAGLLNVRAERVIQFPQAQEIGELRLNFVRLSTDAGALRLSLVKMAPPVAGICALWLIAARALSLDQIAGAAASGALDDLAGAASQLAQTADFWLWFYFAFTIANSMFPELPKMFSARQQSRAIILAGTALLIVWRAAGSIDLSAALAIERLTSSLALITLQIIVMNIVIVVLLGAVEALIERVTGKSATFSAGRMLTMSRQEAQQWKAVQAQTGPDARQRRAKRSKDAVIASVYDLKLPIPGPPGREPVSRSIVAVMDVPAGNSGAEAAAKADKAPEPPTIRLDTSSRVSPPAELEDAPPASQLPNMGKSSFRQDEGTELDRVAPANDENAPFSRPFAGGDSNVGYVEGDESDGAEDADGAQFSRPFNMRTRTNVELDEDPDISRAAPNPSEGAENDNNRPARRRGPTQR